LREVRRREVDEGDGDAVGRGERRPRLAPLGQPVARAGLADAALPILDLANEIVRRTAVGRRG